MNYIIKYVLGMISKNYSSLCKYTRILSGLHENVVGFSVLIEEMPISFEFTKITYIIFILVHKAKQIRLVLISSSIFSMRSKEILDSMKYSIHSMTKNDLLKLSTIMNPANSYVERVSNCFCRMKILPKVINTNQIFENNHEPNLHLFGRLKLIKRF